VLPAGPSQDLMMIAEMLASARAGLERPPEPRRGGMGEGVSFRFLGRRVAEMNRRTRADAIERGAITTDLEPGLT